MRPSQLRVERIPVALADADAVEAIDLLHHRRRSRYNRPQGDFDKSGRWFPSPEENADGDGSKGRRPSKAHPRIYWRRCCTRHHVAVLVARALRGLPVPPDVWAAIVDARCGEVAP